MLDKLQPYRYPLLAGLTGLILVGLGVLFWKNWMGGIPGTAKIEVLNSTTEGQEQSGKIVAEISGEVEKPGVYQLVLGSRIDDLLVAGGGLSAGADRDWVAKNLNRAAKIIDGQKVFIPKTGITEGAPLRQDSAGQGGVVKSSLININTADLKTLDTLPGIGPVYGQNIIEHRPYSSVEELVSKGALKQSVFEKIKDKITVY